MADSARQRRIKARPVNDHLDHDAHVNAYRHQGIPRDANGDPIVLILPAALQAQYEERMKTYEAAWRQHCDPLAVHEATTWAQIYRQSIPKWLAEAVGVLVAEIGKPESERDNKKYAAHRHAARRLEARKQFVRYECVRDLKVSIPGFNEPDPELDWLGAYAKASELLQGTFAAGGADVMEHAYKQVRRDTKAGRISKYFFNPAPKMAGNN